MSVVIKLENISKVYRLGYTGSGSLKDDVEYAWRKLTGQKLQPLIIDENDQVAQSDSNYIWALKEISLEVKHGEILGIIGKNGAGKSTLLKLLSKITSPTSGSIRYKGRVASLLEVGTGFHPELTGKENIYLNGAVLGMTKEEIDRKFDEIIDFAGVRRYVDTPVKRYSSGMKVRLGFAVAAHLEPEILIIDEVLAVGDAEFQKKAVGKMQEISQGGQRTVLFVSHNMLSVQNLCTRTICLENGKIVKEGDTEEVIHYYLNKSAKYEIKDSLEKRKDRKGDQQVKITGYQLLDENEQPLEYLLSGKSVVVRMYYEKTVSNSLSHCRVSMSIHKNHKPYMLLDSSLVFDENIEIRRPQGYFQFRIDKFPLSKGSYSINVFVESKEKIKDFVEGAFEIDVIDGDYYGKGRNYPPGWGGKTVLIDHQFGYN